MVTGFWALALSSGAAAQENVAPIGTPLFGAGANLLGTSDVTVANSGPIREINDGVFNANLAPNGYTINANGQIGANGNGADTFAGGVTTNNQDFVGILFSQPQFGVSSVRVQNFAANDGGWWGANGVVAGGVPLAAADLTAPQVQVTANGGTSWTTISTLSNDYVSKYTGVVRGSGFPNATSGPFATFNFATQNGINGIRLIGSGGGPADGNGFIGVNEFEVIGTPQELSLVVNTTTGRVSLVNAVQSSIELDFYKITSAGGSLDLSPGGWNSFENPSVNPAGFPAGNGTGNGWEELANLNDGLVAEAYLQSASTLAPGGRASLGRLYDGGLQDLALRYRTAAGLFVDVTATYVTGGFAADFNDDGAVNAADLAIWTAAAGTNFAGDADRDGDSDGGDFLLWQQQLGAPAAGTAARAVPEPGGVALGLVAWVAGTLMKRRRSTGPLPVRIERKIHGPGAHATTP